MTMMNASTTDTKKKKDVDKTVHHSTTLRFETEEDLLAALEHYGVDPRGEESRIHYYDDDDEEISYSQMKMLLKHCLPFREVTNTQKVYTYEGDEAAQKRFGMATTPSISARMIVINTYDMNARQHQAEVRKIMRPIRLAGYRCTYECTSETVNKSC